MLSQSDEDSAGKRLAQWIITMFIFVTMRSKLCQPHKSTHFNPDHRVDLKSTRPRCFHQPIALCIIVKCFLMIVEGVNRRCYPVAPVQVMSSALLLKSYDEQLCSMKSWQRAQVGTL